MSTYDPAVAIPTLVGSLLSCFASGLIFVCYIVLPQIPHFRHVLILNLAGADFINSLNNSISGIYLFAYGSLQPGPACTANGFIGQLTVQGTDFAVLAIALATVFALRGADMVPDVSLRGKIIVSVAVWTMPVITSFIALGLGIYSPVSGNWCWISPDEPILRYALTHAWRFGIIITTICLYTYLFIYFRKQFKEIRKVRSTPLPIPESNLPPISENSPTAFELESPLSPHVKFQSTVHHDEEFCMRAKESGNFPDNQGRYARSDTNLIAIPISSSKALTNITSYTLQLQTPPNNRYSHTAILQRKAHEIQKVLLLNAYPIAYVILWLPGITNRMVELGGGKSRVLNILQSSTQYVGLANAVTYGYNEGIKRQLTKWQEERNCGRGRF